MVAKSKKLVGEKKILILAILLLGLLAGLILIRHNQDIREEAGVLTPSKYVRLSNPSLVGSSNEEGGSASNCSLPNKGSINFVNVL